jgi:iron(III) transport system substrate-binding protein
VRILLAAALALALAQQAAGQGPAPEAVTTFGPADAPRRMLVRGTTDLPVFRPVLAAFAALVPDVRITYEQWGSNELHVIGAAACRGEAPVADLSINSAMDLQVSLVNDGCARPHRSALTEALPRTARWRDEVFAVTSEPAVLIYNRQLVPPEDAPRSRFDLLDLLRREDGRYRWRVATYDIERSGVGYLFAFWDSQQATTFGSLVEALARSGAVATCCSAEIAEAVSSGRFLIAYNVLASYALARAETDPNLAIVAPEDYTLSLSRAAMIPRGAAEPVAAGQLIDFLLSDPGRRELARAHLLVDPDDPRLQFAGGNDAALRPIPLSPVLLVMGDRQMRARFLDRWREIFVVE